MIVRIAGEGQFRLPDGDAERLNELDNQAVAAADADDEPKFRELFAQMLELVRNGEALPADDLSVSDILVPPEDSTFDEVKMEFSGEGLIPD